MLDDKLLELWSIFTSFVEPLLFSGQYSEGDEDAIISVSTYMHILL